MNYFFSANTDIDYNDGNINVEVDDYVVTVYNCKAYVGKVFGRPHFLFRTQRRFVNIYNICHT